MVVVSSSLPKQDGSDCDPMAMDKSVNALLLAVESPDSLHSLVSRA